MYCASVWSRWIGVKCQLAVVSGHTRRIAWTRNLCYRQHKGTSRWTQTKNWGRSRNKDMFRGAYGSEHEACCIPVVTPCSLVPIHQTAPCNIPEDSNIYVMTSLNLLRGEDCNRNWGKQKSLLGLSRFSVQNGSKTISWKRSEGGCGNMTPLQLSAAWEFPVYDEASIPRQCN